MLGEGAVPAEGKKRPHTAVALHPARVSGPGVNNCLQPPEILIPLLCGALS